MQLEHNYDEDSSKQQVIGTVFVSANVGFEYVNLNLTPSLNAIFAGCINSLNATFARDEEEVKREEREHQQVLEKAEKAKLDKYILTQKKALKSIWKEIDVDGSDELDQTEVKEVVIKLLQKTARRKDAQFRVGKSNRITTKELNRELVHFMSIVDENQDHSISYMELEQAMLMMTNSKKRTEREAKNGIVYFPNLKEYASAVIVHEITGSDDPLHFDPPLKWVNKKGIEEFFALYTRECGTTKKSLNRQDIKIVQRKLVRLLQNYEFAKFCWQRLVQPNLRGSNYQTGDWKLDKDASSRYSSGAIDVLASHVHLTTLTSIQSVTEVYRYDTSVEVNIDNVTFSAGNALLFSKSLINTTVKDTNAFCKLVFTPDVEGGLHVSTDEADARVGKQGGGGGGVEGGGIDSNESYGLDMHLETTVKMEYLHTTHDVMSSLIEPFSVFINLGYNMEARDYAQEMEVFESDEEAGVVSGQRVFFELNCPDFLKIAFTPEAIRTLNTMSQMLKVTPDVFETLSQERALQELEEMWLEVDETKVQNLGREQVLPIVNKFLGTSITGVDSMSAEEIDKMVQVFIDIVDKDKDGSISFFELEEAVKDHKMSAKSIFENQSSLIRIENAIGIDLHFACVAQLGEEDTARAEASSGFELCEVGFTKSLKLGADFMSRQRSRFFKESDYLALKFENDVFEMLSELNISAFQKIIVPLQLSAGHQMNTAASRFSPAMVLDPKTDALETVTMQVRSCFVVEAHVAIEVQIMVVQRNDDSRHEDFARRRDNRKLSPEDKINALLENATEDFRLSLKESERASIPLSCLISSKLHLLRIRDVSQDKWRSPIKIDRDFLWNISNQKEISNLHRR